MSKRLFVCVCMCVYKHEYVYFVYACVSVCVCVYVGANFSSSLPFMWTAMLGLGLGFQEYRPNLGSSERLLIYCGSGIALKMLTFQLFFITVSRPTLYLLG